MTFIFFMMQTLWCQQATIVTTEKPHIRLHIILILITDLKEQGGKASKYAQATSMGPKCHDITSQNTFKAKFITLIVKRFG